MKIHSLNIMYLLLLVANYGSWSKGWTVSGRLVTSFWGSSFFAFVSVGMADKKTHSSFTLVLLVSVFFIGL